MEKRTIMIHQDKLASMGEMIGNIAHQWRQPLTELGSLFIRLEVCFEQNVLDSKELKLKILFKNQKTHLTYVSKPLMIFAIFLNQRYCNKLFYQ